MAAVYESPTFRMADVDLKFSKPEVRLSVNRNKANLMGVSTRDVAQTLQYGLSGQRMGYLYLNGKQYEIVGEINRQQRNDPNNLKAIYVRSSDGKMIQMENLVDLARKALRPPNSIATTALFRPPFRPDWPRVKPLATDLTKWTA